MLPGLSSVQVSRSVAADYLRGYTWLVSFPDTLGNLALLRTSSALTGSNAKVEVSVERAGVTFDESKVAVAVSQNGQDYTTMSTVVYQYVQTILVYSTFPNHGPVFGGTEVVVYGDYFTNSSTLYCRFGTTMVSAATYFNSTTLTCIAPSVQSPRQVFIDVSTNSKRSSYSNTTTAAFTYDAPVSLKSVTPTLGPATGNFSVEIYGGPFPRTDELRCRFGSVVVQALWVQTDAI
ncbi:hypothetical protein AaE_001858, partial [Aphanomyces astaci]